MLKIKTNTTDKNKLSSWLMMTIMKTKMPCKDKPIPPLSSFTLIPKSMLQILLLSLRTKLKTSFQLLLTLKNSLSLEALIPREKWQIFTSTKRQHHSLNQLQRRNKSKLNSSEMKIWCSTFSITIWYQNIRFFQRSKKSNFWKNSNSFIIF